MPSAPPPEFAHPDFTQPPLLNPEVNSTLTLPPADLSWQQRGLAWLQLNPEIFTILLVLLIGGGTGLAIVLFRYSIDWISQLALEQLMGVISPWGTWTLALVPTLGGLVVGLIRWSYREFQPGIAALDQLGQPLSPRRPLIQVAAAAVSLGTGASLGPEGPSVEIGGSIGILLAQVLRVSQERRRLLLGAGVAAGLAAGFNAPIAGVFLALELFLNATFATTTVGVVLLAAVVAALVAQFGLDGQPSFTLPAYDVRGPWEWPLYMGLGVLASGVSLAFVEAIKLAQRCFQGEVPGFSWLTKLPLPLRPMLGGTLVGLVALQFPQILGIGYETVGSILRNASFPLSLLVGLVAIKLTVTAISLGSGLVGGIFAPAMFLGAALGAAYGKVMALLLPSLIPNLEIAAPPAYAMVGMAAVLAASVRAPLSAILLLFELTQDYRIILPLMAAVGISVLLVEWLKAWLSSGGNQGLNLQQMGLNLAQDPSQALLEQLPVTAMLERQPLCLTADLALSQAAKALLEHSDHSALVISNQGQLVGIFTLQDLNRAITSQAQHLSQPEPSLAQVCSRNLLWVYSDATLADASKRMQALGLHQLPVLDRQAPHPVLGLLTAENISLATKLALSRGLLMAHLGQQAGPQSYNE